MRVGIGYDVHRFAPKRPLRLGGVTLPGARGLRGHSDADVLLHAITDALLGAAGAADIGELFPSRDPKFRHVDSSIFVRTAAAAVRRRGWRIGNIDAIVVTDAPRLEPYKMKMCHRISELLSITPGQVSVKAKTTEAFCPGKHGIAAHAVALLLPARKRA